MDCAELTFQISSLQKQLHAEQQRASAASKALDAAQAQVSSLEQQLQDEQQRAGVASKALDAGRATAAKLLKECQAAEKKATDAQARVQGEHLITCSILCTPAATCIVPRCRVNPASTCDMCQLRVVKSLVPTVLSLVMKKPVSLFVSSACHPPAISLLAVCTEELEEKVAELERALGLQQMLCKAIEGQLATAHTAKEQAEMDFEAAKQELEAATSNTNSLRKHLEWYMHK